MTQEENKRPTIADDFPQVEIKTGYEPFFNELMAIVNKQPIDNNLGEALKEHVFRFLKNCDLNDFQEFTDTLYKRIHIGKDVESGWETIMMCWKKGNQTAIHGHPKFAAYNIAYGRFLVEVFQKQEDGTAKLLQSFEAEKGQGFYAIGNDEKSFDNHIHRITCLSDIGHSLHVYSDDARKGKKYNE